MTRVLILVSILAAALISVSGQTVSGSIGSGTVRRGTTARGSVVLTLPKELHVNSNRPGSEYLIPTVVRVSGKQVGLTRVKYPRGKDRKFQFTEKLLNVYEGTVAFPFQVTVPRSYRRRTVSVRAVVDFQACTEEVCYSPRRESITITAAVR